MTQQPFSRPGAIDLSALSDPPPTSGADGRRGARRTGAYAVEVDEQNFQGLLEASMTAPVLLVFYSRTQMPESGQLADDMAVVAGEYDGRFLAGLVDIDAVPGNRAGDAASLGARSSSLCSTAGRCRSSRTWCRSTSCARPSTR